MAEILNKKALIARVAETRADDIPPHLTATVMELIIGDVAGALSEGREVVLRGFGRIIPRFYHNSPAKRVGLLFHPSPRLTAKCNKAPGHEPGA
jgi:nucleoid DNA-binding protein